MSTPGEVRPVLSGRWVTLRASWYCQPKACTCVLRPGALVGRELSVAPATTTSRIVVLAARAKPPCVGMNATPVARQRGRVTSTRTPSKARW